MNWNEKYRPNSLDEVIGQSHIVDKLKAISDRIKEDGKSHDIGHLLFQGGPGTGKTATAIAFAKSTFGDLWHRNFIEINASDEGKIDDIRTTIKDYAMKSPIGTFQTKQGEKPIPFNIIFLDEADHLTGAAQAALRRIMEKYSDRTIFIISCNYPHKIIKPIRDRCAFTEVRFRPISPSIIKEGLRKIIANEGLNVDDEALDEISKMANGSMRKAQQILFDLSLSGHVTMNRVREVKIDNINGLKMIMNLRNGNIRDIDKYLDNLYYYKGWGADEIINAIFDDIKDRDFDGKDKILVLLGKYAFRVSLTENKILQLKCMIREMANV